MGALSIADQGAGLLGAVDGNCQTLDQVVPTFDVPGVKPCLGGPPGHPSGSSQSVIADANNNYVLVLHPTQLNPRLRQSSEVGASEALAYIQKH